MGNAIFTRMRTHRMTAFLFSIGLVGAAIAYVLGWPMPYLFGSLFVVGLFSIVYSEKTGRKVEFPRDLRRLFIAFIGVMIGATFSPDLLAAIPRLWLSVLAMALFVAIVFSLNYLVLRRIGKYDQPTAVYAAMPGGLVEAVHLGEKAGGDVRILSAQHFARIMLVLLTIPLIFYLWSGELVGSAAGQDLSSGPYTWVDLGLIVAVALAGLYFGPFLRIPAPHLMAPLIFSAVLHASGVYEIANPPWLLNLAQLVVGAGLGAMFSGASLSLLARAFALATLSVAIMLLIGGGFAYLLAQVKTLSFAELFLSFAPGGVAEMNLIALSLGISPVVVATHHLIRILLTISFASYLAGRFDRDNDQAVSHDD